MTRSSVVASILLALLLPASAGAQADGHERAPALPNTTAGATLVVHYTTTGADAIAESSAQELLTEGERLYAALRADFGLPAHVPDGDGRIDVYVYGIPTLTTGTADAITNSDDPNAVTSSSYIRIRTSAVNAYRGLAALAHELMHVFQFSTWQPTSTDEGVALSTLYESIANLAVSRHVDQSEQGRAMPVGATATPFVHPDARYDRWPFFAMLAEDRGGAVIGRIYTALAEAGAADRIARPTQALETVLAEGGQTLADALASFAVRMAGRQAGAKVDVTGSRLSVQPLAPYSVTLPEQSHQHVLFGPKRRRVCEKRTLDLAVTVPAGAPVPVLVLHPSGTSVPVVGELRRPWRPCKDKATLVLANPGVTPGAAFSVTSRLLKPKPKRRPGR